MVVKTAGDEVMAKELKRRTSKTIELRSLNSEHGDRQINISDVVVDGAHPVGEPVGAIPPL